VRMCACIYKRLKTRTRTVPMPKVVISWPSLLSARRMFSLMSLLATMDRDKKPSAIDITL
jgi:hypothetical protein